MNSLFFFLPLILLGTPLRVPTDFYSGAEKNGDDPGYAPLIADRTFRTLSDHIIDQDAEWFDPSSVKQGDIIYLNLWYIEWFATTVHDQIEFPYILLSCDVGDWYPNPQFQKLLYDPKLSAWFCRNIVFSYHPKLFQIPMGQTDRYFGYHWLPVLEDLSGQRPFEKIHLLYMNFLPREFGDRKKIVRLFENKPYCFTRTWSDQPYSSITKGEYYKELAASEFVLSPFGLESDCVRTWETLILGSIPIVEHTFLDPLFEDLPVLVVHDWEEIDEGFLKEKKKELKLKKLDKAFFGYWERLIRETQDKVRKGDLFFTQPEAAQFNPEELADLLAILERSGQTNLVYRGFLSAIHALQIAQAPFLSKIQLFDPWGSQQMVRSFVKDPILLKNQKKITFCSFKTFDTLFPLQASQKRPIFFDFSFYRNSLMCDPDLKKMRHSLKKDLFDLYALASPGTLFCGNKIENEYVQKVLNKLSSELNLSIERKGDFWFFVK